MDVYRIHIRFSLRCAIDTEHIKQQQQGSKKRNTFNLIIEMIRFSFVSISAICLSISYPGSHLVDVV